MEKIRPNFPRKKLTTIPMLRPRHLITITQLKKHRNKTPDRLPGSIGLNVAKKPNAQKAATNKPTAIRMNFRLMFITIGSLWMLVVDCLPEPYS
ncbi:MAG: hypothetical protein VYA02_06855 [Planctomycetota bacterium]|nr:hypothetical protein [Planctomycetota bacterium]